MPDQPASLAAALVQFQATLPKIVKNATGQIQNRTYQYATLANIHEIVMPMLAALGLAWICTPTLTIDGQFVLRYRLWHVTDTDADDILTGDYPLGTGNAQQLGSAITYARRYTLCAVLGLVADDDDDGTAATQEWHPPANPRTRKADRHNAGRSGPLPDDDWTTGPPEDQPGTIQPGQLTQLHAWFTKKGITERDDRLAYAMSALDLPELATSNDLSMAQADTLIKHLKEDKR